MNVYFTPTTEVHLVLKSDYSSRFKNFEFEVVLSDLENVKEGISYLDFDPNIVTLSPSGNKHMITAVGYGRTIGRVIYKEVDGTKYECLVNVRVHEGIDYFWVGNNQITVHADSKGKEDYKYLGYVPSVYAKFSDGDIGDITYHPYIQYTEVNAEKRLDISNHIVKVKSNVGENTSELSTKVKIELEGTSFASDLNVKIKKAFNTKREIVKKVHKGINTTSMSTNILILGEGFKNEGDFEAYRDIVVNEMLTKPVFSPWNLIKESLTIWSAFEATNDSVEGINIIQPINIDNGSIPDPDSKRYEPNSFSMEELILKVGLANEDSPQNKNKAIIMGWPRNLTDKLEDPTLQYWYNRFNVKGFIENKDSIFGVISGERYGDNTLFTLVSESYKDKIDWYKTRKSTTWMDFDRRRYPTPKHLPTSFIGSRFSKQYVLLTFGPLDQYLETLKYKKTNVTNPENDPEYNIGKIWQSTGKDARKILIICNTNKIGGINKSAKYNSIESNGFGIILSTLDRMVKLNDISFSEQTRAKLNENFVAVNWLNQANNYTVARVNVHELTHSYNIGDEYEGSKFPSTENTENTVNEHANLMSLSKVLKNGTPVESKKIDPSKIKWNLPRVALSSRIVNDTTKNGDKLTIKVDKHQSEKWETVRSSNLPLYIRSSNYDLNEAKWFYQIAIEKITSIDSMSNTIVLQIKSSDLSKVDVTKLKKGSHIFLPKRLYNDYNPQNAELSVINPRIFEYLNSTSESFVMKTGTQCDIVNSHPHLPPSDSEINLRTVLSQYPKVVSPATRFLVSGIYEGGGTYNCKVYRGNGFSIMRGGKNQYQEVIDSDENGPINIYASNQIIFYAELDFIVKYLIVTMEDPNKLEDLDKQEYKYSDRSILNE